MPSNTFFNLPEEKRETILEAAREEFSRVPYEKASINKMIRAAKIPRGSFYMYFTDKEDLFHHLMQFQSDQVVESMAAILAERRGDIFAAVLGFYDAAVLQFRQGKEDAAYKKLAGIMMRNPVLGQAYMTSGRETILSALAEGVDASRLDLRGEDDMETILMTLMGILAHAVMEALCSPTSGPAQIRNRLENTLDIMRRGMEKRPQTTT